MAIHQQKIRHTMWRIFISTIQTTYGWTLLPCTA